MKIPGAERSLTALLASSLNRAQGSQSGLT
ncbi:hypothetical protein PS928_03994 [Pseudomonas fluorescens]|uniref:Uncharacterized protein n=1 Tax=Pseudomonas fluorescens TaxID=294 RepID=A0A5E7V0I7_PSEFL|nr:hypothetical protein PS928_03994 [Pseudomonas fluorescens]